MSLDRETRAGAAAFLRQLRDSGEEVIFLADRPGTGSGQPEGSLQVPERPAAASGEETLEEFGLRISDCRICRLHQSRTHFVFGAGDPDADLMFVGEGPGREEDLQGAPFVGASGQLLTRIIASIGFTRGEVYITNMVKCRPPQNRDPLPDEIATCEKYLLTQIEKIRPKVIVTLGRFSACYFHGREAPLGRLRGAAADFDGIKVVSTYHPAALLRNPQYKRDTWNDMLLARKVYDQQGGKPSSGKVFQGPEKTKQS